MSDCRDGLCLEIFQKLRLNWSGLRVSLPQASLRVWDSDYDSESLHHQRLFKDKH